MEVSSENVADTSPARQVQDCCTSSREENHSSRIYVKGTRDAVVIETIPCGTNEAPKPISFPIKTGLAPGREPVAIRFRVTLEDGHLNLLRRVFYKGDIEKLRLQMDKVKHGLDKSHDVQEEKTGAEAEQTCNPSSEEIAGKISGAQRSSTLSTLQNKDFCGQVAVLADEQGHLLRADDQEECPRQKVVTANKSAEFHRQKSVAADESDDFSRQKTVTANEQTINMEGPTFTSSEEELYAEVVKKHGRRQVMQDNAAFFREVKHVFEKFRNNKEAEKIDNISATHMKDRRLERLPARSCLPSSPTRGTQHCMTSKDRDDVEKYLQKDIATVDMQQGVNNKPDHQQTPVTADEPAEAERHPSKNTGKHHRRRASCQYHGDRDQLCVAATPKPCTQREARVESDEDNDKNKESQLQGLQPHDLLDIPQVGVMDQILHLKTTPITQQLTFDTVGPKIENRET